MLMFLKNFLKNSGIWVWAYYNYIKVIKDAIKDIESKNNYQK